MKQQLSLALIASMMTITAIADDSVMAEPVGSSDNSVMEASVVESSTASVTQVNITVDNVKSDKGSIYISVYDSKDTFLGEDSILKKVVSVADNLDGNTVVTELTLPFGEYAITTFHDANDNKKMDTNFIGLPKEPVALSNGHVPRFGPPRYKKAKIILDQAQHDEILKLD